MKIDDAVKMAELTTGFMKADAKIRNVEHDYATLQLIEVMDTLADYAKKHRAQEIVKEAFKLQDRSVN